MTSNPLNTLGRCRLLLPPVIYAAPGREANLYFDNIVLQSKPGRFLFDVTCEKGIQHEDRWFWTPDEAGDFPLQIEVQDEDGGVLASAQTIIHVAHSESGADKTLTLLCIGDSLTAASIYTAELLKLCENENNPRLTLLGTRQPDSTCPRNRHEGYSGWRYETFLTRWEIESEVENQPPLCSPFLFLENDEPKLNFSRYLDEKLSGATPNVITLMLGINDVFMASESTRQPDVEVMVSSAKTLVQEIRAATPAAAIGVLPLAPPCISQDSFGETNGTSQTRWGYLKNRSLANEQLMQEFGNREAEKIFIVPAHLNLDGAHHFPSVETNLNARSEIKKQLFNNEVHPSTEGYAQIADSIYGWLKFLAEQSEFNDARKAE